MDSLRERDDNFLFGRSNSKKIHISSIKDKYKKSNNTSKSRSHEQVRNFHLSTNEAGSASSTSFKSSLQHDRFHKAEINHLGISKTTLNKPPSTVNALKSEFFISNQGPSTTEGNPAHGIYDHIPALIFGTINSEMKIDVLDMNGLYAKAEKIKILYDIAARCNSLAVELKGKMKTQVDILKFKHPNEKDTQYIKELEAILEGVHSTFAVKSPQGISDVIPERIKGIILKTISTEKKSLAVSDFEVFFNKTKNKRNIKCIAKSLNISISRLKQQLKEIKNMYDRDPVCGNKEENQFMRRLERMIKSLN